MRHIRVTPEAIARHRQIDDASLVNRITFKFRKPKNVPAKMKELLSAYNAKNPVTIDDIISFHADFEHIHPFQDGNGRDGRLVALKECLRHNIVPFIIEDSKKSFYYRGLSEWGQENGYLTDTCLDGQDTFTRLLDALDIPHP